MSDSFVIFAFIAVIIFLFIKVPSHKKEPKEPQERDEFDEHLGVPSLFIPPASSFPPVAPPATAPSIYAQQGKCRNHAAFSTLKTIKQPL